MAQTIIDIIQEIIGPVPYGLDFLFILGGLLLLIFVFHLLEHLFEILFSKFFH